jgi:hypothetical protein
LKGFSYLEPQLQLQNPFIPVLLRSYKLKEWGSSGVHSCNFLIFIIWNGIFNSITSKHFASTDFHVHRHSTNLFEAKCSTCMQIINTWGIFPLGCCDHRFYLGNSFPFLFNVVCHQSHPHTPRTQASIAAKLCEMCVF